MSGAEIDDRDIEAAEAVITAEGWPSRDRAAKWLARVLRVASNVAARHVSEGVAAEREACIEAVGGIDRRSILARGRGVSDAMDATLDAAIEAIRARGGK